VQNKVFYKLEKYIKYFWTLEVHKVVILKECSQGLKYAVCWTEIPHLCCGQTTVQWKFQLLDSIFHFRKKGYTLNGTVAYLLQMQEVLNSDLTHRPAVLTEVYHGFPKSLQANGRVVFSVKAQLFFHDMPKSVFTYHFVIWHLSFQVKHC